MAYLCLLFIITSTKIEQELRNPPYLNISCSGDGGLGEGSIVHRPPVLEETYFPSLLASSYPLLDAINSRNSVQPKLS